jgi:deoxyribonuclease V
MPYIPGLLAFREVPVLMEALAALRTRPDLLLCDGQGLAHPRRCGVACHLGVLTGLPAIGVGKSRLLGRHGEVPDERGGWVELIDAGEVVGAVVRSRPGVKPIHVSVGHRLDLAAAVDWVMRCTRGFRLPETTRMADALASGRC